MTREHRSTRRRPRHARRRPARRARARRRRRLAPATAAARPADLARPGRCSRHGAGAVAGSPGWPARPGRPSLATVLVAFAAVWLTVAALERSDRRRVADAAGGSPTRVQPRRAGRASPSTPQSPRRHRACPSCRSTAPCRIRPGDGPIGRDVSARRPVDRDARRPASVGTYAGPTDDLARPSGGWACICTDWTGSSGADGARRDASNRSPPTAARGTATPLRTVRGEPDPSLSDGGPAAARRRRRSAARRTGAMPSSAGARGMARPAGRPAWTSSISAAARSSVRCRSRSPSRPAPATGPPSGSRRRSASRRRATRSSSSSFWYVDDPSATPPSGTDHWISLVRRPAAIGAPAAGGLDGRRDVRRGRQRADRRDDVLRGLCLTPARSARGRAASTDGSRIDTTAVPGTTSGLEESSLVLRQGDRLFIWDPVAARLARFDLRTATMDSAAGTALGAPRSGRRWTRSRASAASSGAGWRRPSAAKIFSSRPSSRRPTGRRIYGLGVDAPSVATVAAVARHLRLRRATRSTPVGHWAPTADLVVARPSARTGSSSTPPARRASTPTGRQRAVLGVDHGLRRRPTARSGLIAGAARATGSFFPSRTTR